MRPHRTLAPADAPGRRRRLAAMIATVLAASGMGGLLLAAPAAADGPTTFSNTTAIAVPATGSPGQTGPASPYPSPITVSGMDGPVSDVQVTLTGVTHPTTNDLDVLLVAPSGESLIVLSDPGDPTTQTWATNATFTFTDSAASSFPQGGAVPSGTFRPTNTGNGDSFPAPAPPPSTAATFGAAFTGINANGTWNLFVVDDAGGDLGSIDGGWSLTLTTTTAAVATTTTLVSAPNPSRTGDAVVLTATVTAGGSPVDAGTVTFARNGVAIGAPVPVASTGIATLTTSTFPEGTHPLTATYSGASGFLGSVGSVTQVVDNDTIVIGTSFCNPGVIELDDGRASVYPSRVFVTGLTGRVVDAELTVRLLSHTEAGDLDILLASPDPADNLLVLSDVPGMASNVELTMTDHAASHLSTMATGSWKPTNLTGGTDAMPAPAPVLSAATTMADAFAGTSANGVWSLYINDDATGDWGSIDGGWCLDLTVETEPAPTTLTLTAPATATDGDPVTLSATVATGDPAVVPTGEVTFSADGTDLGTAALTNGVAALTTSALPAGVRTVTATYAPDDGFVASDDDAEIAVSPVVDAGGPYAIAEGDPLTLTATASSGATVGWDLDGDGDYSDAAGTSVTLGWAELEPFGIDDGPASLTIAAQASVDGLTGTDTAALEVSNTGPEVVVDGPSTAVVGEPLTLELSADDPGSADMSAMFTYVIDWGDGSPVEEVVGPADPPVVHTYTAAGDVDATFAVRDRDGDAGGSLTLTIAVSPAEEPTTEEPTTDEPTDEPTEGPTSQSPTPSESPTQAGPGLPSTGADPTLGWVALGLLAAGGVVLVVRRRFARG